MDGDTFQSNAMPPGGGGNSRNWDLNQREAAAGVVRAVGTLRCGAALYL